MSTPERVKVRGDLYHGKIPGGAVYVGRSAPGLPASIYANPFKVGEKIGRGSELWPYIAPMLGADDPRFPLAAVSFQRTEDVVNAYSLWILEQPPQMIRMGEELGGRDLACWCKPSAPCHADLLIALANGWDMPPEPTRSIFGEWADA